MKYAHLGNSSDNAFTTLDGHPTRKFMAFSNTQERNSFREQVWQNSGKSKNLIDCKRVDVIKWYGKNFQVDSNGFIHQEE